MHFEQRWIDLVPSLFADVVILRDPAYNVGHWNITERLISADPAGEHVRTAGRPCALVRFSGYDPDTPERVTRYTDRVLVADLGSARRVFERYRRELLEAGWAQALDAEYGFATFADGVPVPDAARAMLGSLTLAERERFGDPFSIGPDSFRAWMTAPVDERRPRISRLLQAVYADRGDLREAFPDPLGADRTAFAGWARRAGSQLGIRPELDPATPPDRDMVAVTVVTPDRLPHARVLADSLSRHHPDLALRVVVVGAPSSDEVRADEPFEPLDCADLGLDELDVLLLRGAVADAVTQAKPAALEALLALGHECVLYVDADTQAIGDLGPLLDAVRSHPVVLLPHCVDPPSTPPDLSHELLLLKAGTMNAGVVGVRAGPQATAFLRWWNDRLGSGLTSNADAGVYYDQRWLDLAPGMFDGVHVLRDARFDVGPWNVRERRDVDWRLMHHSGFDPDQPDVIWGHAPSARFDDVEAVGPVYAQYAEQLRAAGLVAGAGRRPGGVFADGTAVPEPAAQIAAALGTRRRRFGNLLASGPGSFQDWLAAPADDAEPAVVQLWHAIHGLREDLRAAFPEPLGVDREAYVCWCRSHGTQEHPVDSAFAP